ncbi:MAG TPA: alpha/beta fold hydrolase [Ilumatobacter sp.]|nr:alpha/beta fold hydrolase [Ilumatobacter sp.]
MSAERGHIEVAPGVEVAWAAHGDPAAPALVLVHGYTGGAHDWAGVADELARTSRVITVEHRGHGASTNTGDPATYTFAQLAADLAVALDAIAPPQFDLLGHSMGGIVAMHYAIAHADRLRSLVLMDTAARAAGDGPDNPMRQGVEHVRATGDLMGLFAAFSGILPADAREQLERSWAMMDPVAFVALGDALLTHDDGLLERLATVTVPTTVIVGEHDAGLRQGADDLAATIPEATLVVIPDAAHSPQVENRTAWLNAIHTHLSR